MLLTLSFELTFFLAHAKQCIQINKLLCIIQNPVKVVYEKIASEDTFFFPAYEDTIFVSDNL